MVTKKRPKTDRQKAVKHADDWMSKYVRMRDKRCVLCGATDRLTAGHLITRAKYSTRWSIWNVFAHCTSCNMKHEYQPEHFTEWYLKRFGVEMYEQLIAWSNKPRKYTNDEIREIGDNFKELCNG